MRQPAWLWRAGGYRAWLAYWHQRARLAKRRDDRRRQKFAYVPLDESVRLTREVLREHFEAMGGTFTPAGRAHYHNADATPITGGWACYCDHPETRERP